MTYFLFLTALTVSIDSFVCGFSLSFLKGKKFIITVGISSVVLLMCLIANYSAVFLSGFLTEKEAGLGGIILIAVGIVNLFKRDDNKTDNGGILKRSLASGFAVGLDGALANLSLSLMGINDFFVPVFIAFMHAVMISLGILLSKTPLINKVGKVKWLPPLVLIGLGAYKLLSCFL